MPDSSDPLEVQPIVGDDEDDEMIPEVNLEPDDAPMLKPASPAPRKPPAPPASSAASRPAPQTTASTARPRSSAGRKPQPIGIWIGLAVGGLVVVGLIVLGILGMSGGDAGDGGSPANAENPFEI